MTIIITNVTASIKLLSLRYFQCFIERCFYRIIQMELTSLILHITADS